MPISASVFTRNKSWADDRDNAIKITAVRHDEHDGDIADALNAIMGGTAGFIGATLHAAGTASLPGIAFNGDPDTGIYRVGANQIGIATSGSVALSISAAGVVTLASALPMASGGTGATTAVAAHDALSTQGTAIASATTTDIGAATGKSVHITGTTTITGFGTKTAGVVRILTFDDALTLTHNATSLILPGGANITTSAGDTAVMVSEGSGNWRCLSYQYARGNKSRTLAKTANFSITAADDGVTFLTDASGGTFTAMLPDATTVSSGFSATLKKDDSIILVDVASFGGTIDGAATFPMRVPNQACTFMSDGTNWHIVADGRVGMRLLANISATSGTSRALTDIGEDYRKLYVELDSVSFTTADYLQIELSSTNGSSHGAGAQVSPSLASAGDSVSGWFEVGNIQSTTSNAKTLFTSVVRASDGVAQTNLVRRSPTDTAARTNALQFTGGAGGTFDSGAIRVYGIR